MIAIILIALALRLYHLTYHSLWFDEAISVYWARQTVPRILEVGFSLVEDRLPPLYYLTLKGWTAVFGFSEVSVRLPSVFLGLLVAPVIAGVAAMLFQRRVALFTALLVAVNPFLIWYAQEARMYAPAVLFSALTVWAFLKIVEGKRRKLGEGKIGWADALGLTPLALLFILFAVAGLYSHLYTGFLLPALGLWLLFSYPRAWRLWLAFAGGMLLISLLFLPIGLAIWRFSGQAVPGDPLAGLGGRAWWLLQAFTVWKAPLPASLQRLIPITVAFFSLAAYLKSPGSPPSSPASPRPKNSLLLVTLLLLFPFLIANLLLLRNHLAFFGERYFIVMVPWLLLLAAVGAVKLGKAAQRLTRRTQYAPGVTYLPFIGLLAATAIPLPGQWSIPAAKEAWRQSVAFLAEQAAPDHAILIHPDWVRHPFQFYFQGPGQTYAAFSNVTPETALDEPLQGVVDDHPVVWLIQSHLDDPDPDHRVEQWLANRYPLVTELYPPGISLKGYAPGYRLEALPPAAVPVDLKFENGLHLIGYRADSTATATDPLFHPPSGWVHLTLYWTTWQPPAVTAAPYARLVGPEGVWGESLDRPNDALKQYPPARWQPGQIIRHDLDVNLNPVMPPGTYQLVVGLAGSETEYPLTTVQVGQ